MNEPDPLLLDQQLCFAVYSTSLAMTKLYKSLLEPLQITYPQYLVLLVLWEKDGITLKETAHRLHQNPGALTPVVKRLEGMGLLSRRRDARDERNLAIELTQAGRAMREKAEAVNADFAQHCGIWGSEFTDLRATLINLRNRLEADLSI
ncbi:MAG: MarR family transcriptional regulator [Acidobacteriota bacterium]|nr:MarR family transcriptional regulator [Acidobacteriota bacterium]